MGQNTSRHHHRDTPSVSVPAVRNSPRTDPVSSIATSTEPHTSSPTSRRSSIRKNILGLLKPSSRSSSTLGPGTRSKHKSWRSSKRWSTVPPPQSDLTQSSSGSSTVSPAESSHLSTITAPASPIVEKEGEESEDSSDAIGAGSAAEAVERIAELPVHLEPSTPPEIDQHSPSTILTEASPNSPEDATQGDREAGQNIGAWLSAQTQGSQHSQPNGPADVEEATHSPVLSDSAAPPLVTEAPGQPTTSGAEDSSSTTPQTQGRSFPPPGTLVVVQGVVHTTDVPPRPPSSDSQSTRRSSSTPPNPSERRSRLSALLHSRPSSMIAPRPPSTIDTSSLAPPAPVSSDPVPASDNNQPESSNASQSNSAAQLVPTDAPVQEGSNSSVAAPATEEPGTISSSSIDILGTLLSVAAAATAASLLTGSSEPIMSSGLAPPAYNPDAASPAFPSDPWLSRPTSPTPTAGLGLGMNTDNTRPERLRSAWGNIRERLGLRPSAGPASPLGNIDPNSPTILNPTDPREVMMAQMARAFNLGFGMGGEGSGPGSSGNGGTEESGDSALPPEGSFERFLVDLQADLRVALTSPGGLGGEAGHTPEHQQQQTAAAPSETATSISSASAHSHANTPRVTPIADDNTDDDDDMPELGSVSDSDSEFVDAHEPEDDSDILQPPPVVSPALDGSALQAPLDNDNSRSGESSAESATSQRGAAAPADPVSNTQTGGSAPRRINWWRLYRFPPITAPRTPNAAGATAATPSPFGLNTFSPPSSSPSSSDPAPPLPEMDPTLAELPFANADEADESPQRSHMVVPVIVVGLQSVNTTNTTIPHHGPMDDGEGSSEGGEEDHDADGGYPGSRLAEDHGRNTPAGRGRPWHSRAADAIRNLRPGRRHRAAPAAVLPGRTFLIYVIGGYYPPDHSIVTGGPSSLDSFEALLELAELLGQVKPPTVTKEDIEKSGLEIIKPSQIGQYEKENKIASNCTERCLICLDDYEPEDEIRLMTCRHGFHKSCVDKWLETGRNNCPACRSKGVSLDAPLSTAMP